ncbi:MAG: hypothetical protein V4792_09990 [Pseudomonadota bacterium]
MTAIGHYGLAGLLWIAALLQFAMIRDWTVTDSKIGLSARWVLCAGLSGLAARFSFVLWDEGMLKVPFSSALSMTFIALGLIVMSLERIVTQPKPGCPGRRTSDHVPIGDLRHVGGGRK